MSDASLSPAARTRCGLAEVMLGGAVALVAATVSTAAFADLAPVADVTPPARPAPRIASTPPAPAPAPILIAFQAPVADGQVGSPFGLRQLPWEAHARLHAGVDLETPGPEPVVAAADGVVTRVGQDPGYGRFVELTHAEGLVTVYGHLRRFAPGLASGTAVKAGTPVGELGSTGSSTGPHLHFEVRDAAGHPMNPELFLGRAFARAEDLPLKAARRLPRGVRVAYVSRIPRSKQAEMQARLDGDAAQASGDEAEATGVQHVVVRRSHGRVHSRITF